MTKSLKSITTRSGMPAASSAKSPMARKIDRSSPSRCAKSCKKRGAKLLLRELMESLFVEVPFLDATSLPSLIWRKRSGLAIR
jgi:hypothetical protein